MNPKRRFAAFTSGLCLTAFAGTASSIYDQVTSNDLINCNTATCTFIELSDSAGRSATAVFEIFGSTDKRLKITLINSAAAQVDDPSEVLTALFFNLKDNNGNQIAFTPLSARMNGTVNGNSFTSRTVDLTTNPDTICEGVLQETSPTCNAGNYDVDGEWAYEAGLNFNGFAQGLSSTGLDIFGAPIGTPNLSGPTAVNGGQYGIISAAGATYNNPAYNPVAQNAVQFKLNADDALLTSLNLESMKMSGALQAGFQYGTSVGEPFLTPIPGSLTLLGLGVLSLFWTRRKLPPLAPVA